MAQARITPTKHVTVRIPASVGGDMAQLTKVLANLGESFGCRMCFSGVDCTFVNTHDWVVDPPTHTIMPSPAIAK